MRMRFIAIVCALFLCCIQAAFGTTLVRMDLDDLTSQSNAVAYGRITASRTEWDSTHSLIYTVYTVQPIEYLKGQLGPSFELRELGGERDGLGMRVSSVPVFTVGEEAVLFVWTDASGVNQVIGFEQGALAVQTDAPSGNKFVDRSIRLGSARAAVAGSAVRTTSKSLMQLFQQIRSSAASSANAAASGVATASGATR